MYAFKMCINSSIWHVVYPRIQNFLSSVDILGYKSSYLVLFLKE